MSTFIEFIWGTVIDPRGLVQKIINLKLGDIIVVQAVLLIAICSTILTYFFLQIIANGVTSDVTEPTVLLNEVVSYISSIQPIYFAANQVFQMLVFSVIITVGGKIFNGKGRFFEALICITIVEAVLILLKILQLILLPISPMLAFIIIIPGVLWSLWAFSTTAAFIHGFKSTLLTFCGGAALIMLFIISLNFFY